MGVLAQLSEAVYKLVEAEDIMPPSDTLYTSAKDQNISANAAYTSMTKLTHKQDKD